MTAKQVNIAEMLDTEPTPPPSENSEFAEGFLLTFLLPILAFVFSPLFLLSTFWYGLALWLNWNWHLAPHIEFIGSISYLPAVALAFFISTLFYGGKKHEVSVSQAIAAPAIAIMWGWLLYLVIGWLA